MIKTLKIFVLSMTIICIGLIIAYIIVLNKPVDKRWYGKIETRDGLIYKLASNDLYEGTFRDTVGERIIEYDVVKGIRNGSFKVLTKNGIPLVLGYIKNNKNEGEWHYFNSRGLLECVGYFQNDKVTSKWVWFYPNGSIKEEGFFMDGGREGNWISYDENGTVLSRTSFKNDIMIDQLKAEKLLSI